MGLCNLYFHKHTSRGTNAVTADTAKCSNLPNFIQNKKNAISCSCPWIGSIWLLLELPVPVLQVRPYTIGCSPMWQHLAATRQLRALGWRSPGKGATQSLGFRLGAQITLHTQTLPAKGFLMYSFQQRNSIQFIVFFETFVEQQEQKEGSLKLLAPIFLICHCKMKFKKKYTPAWENQINPLRKINFPLTNKNWPQYQKSDWYWNVAWSPY